MTKLLNEVRFIALAVKKTDTNHQEVDVSLSTVSKSHRHRVDKMHQVFMKLLKAHNELFSLYVKVSDPGNPLMKISQFLAIVKGQKTLIKFTMLKCALVLCISKYKMTHVARGLDPSHSFPYKFQSTTWDTNLKSLFLYFSKKGMNYNHPNDFMKSSGSHVVLLNKKLAKSLILVMTLHLFLIGARFTLTLSRKLKSQSRPKDHKHLLYLLNFLIGVTSMLIRFSMVTSWKFTRRKIIDVIDLEDKKRHATLKNPTLHDSSCHMDAVELIDSKHTCAVYWVNYYRLICLPDQN